jgi:hypothetical protein
MPEVAKTKDAPERPQDRRRVRRIPFKATSIVTDSAKIVVAQTTELSRFGCFLQTTKPHPQGTRVHIEIAETGTTFVASGVVAYVTEQGMGVVFSMIEPHSYEILSNWLSRTPRRFDRYAFRATAEVKAVGSRAEVLMTRDLSAGGCFIKTANRLPKGSQIHIRIEHGKEEFSALARVTDNITAEGMGVEFVEVSPKNGAILEKWLANHEVNQQTRTSIEQ